MKIVSIVGTRPQFIKAAPVSRGLQEARHTETIVHTGQHYDHDMSQVFFEELYMAEPNINLRVGSGPHGRQTGEMLIRIEEVLLAEKPDWVFVYGDTNSTLAGALAACKLRIRLAHVEAGLRSFNREMPEEHNRVLTDHCSDLLFCPTQTAVDNLAQEGITRGVHLVGDTMYDVALQIAPIARQRSTILRDLKLMPKSYVLATIHRSYNTDTPESLRNILSAFHEIAEPIVFPVHPRTRKKIAELDGKHNLEAGSGNMKMIEPVGYLDMLMLEQNARLILTDSGGIQKEAYFFGVPCVTLRSETEWVEVVEAGWNRIAGSGKAGIVQAFWDAIESKTKPQTHLFGKGNAGEIIVKVLSNVVS